MKNGNTVEIAEYGFKMTDLNPASIARIERENFEEENKKAVIVQGPKNALVMIAKEVLDGFLPIDNKVVAGQTVRSLWGSTEAGIATDGAYESNQTFVITINNAMMGSAPSTSYVHRFNAVDEPLAGVGTSSSKKATLLHSRAVVIPSSQIPRVEKELEKILTYERKIPFKVKTFDVTEEIPL
jgi:hypothetical protein